jgi:hypothetical protein
MRGFGGRGKKRFVTVHHPADVPFPPLPRLPPSQTLFLSSLAILVAGGGGERAAGCRGWRGVVSASSPLFYPLSFCPLSCLRARNDKKRRQGTGMFSSLALSSLSSLVRRREIVNTAAWNGFPQLRM